jgi:hypothetical protein
MQGDFKGVSFATNWNNVENFLKNASEYSQSKHMYDHFGLVLSKSLTLNDKDSSELFKNWETKEDEEKKDLKTKLNDLFQKRQLLEFNKECVIRGQRELKKEDMNPVLPTFRVITKLDPMRDFGDLKVGFIILVFKYTFTTEIDGSTESHVEGLNDDLYETLNTKHKLYQPQYFKSMKIYFCQEGEHKDHNYELNVNVV